MPRCIGVNPQDIFSPRRRHSASLIKEDAAAYRVQNEFVTDAEHNQRGLHDGDSDLLYIHVLHVCVKPYEHALIAEVIVYLIRSHVVCLVQVVCAVTHEYIV